MAKALRHKFASRFAGKVPPAVTTYEITDPHFRPDLRGEFAGRKVRRVGGKYTVTLTDKQAKYYLTQGVLKPVATLQ